MLADFNKRHEALPHNSKLQMDTENKELPLFLR